MTADKAQVLVPVVAVTPPVVVTPEARTLLRWDDREGTYSSSAIL
jgi:hypothetical protein